MRLDRSLFYVVSMSALLAAPACTPANASPANEPRDGALGDGGVVLDGTLSDGAAPAYVSADFETNTAAERDLLARFDALSTAMKAAERSADARPTYTELSTLYTAGGFHDATSTYFQTRADGILMSFAMASGNAWSPAMAPSSVGGRGAAGSSVYMFDGRGVDLRQTLEKGFFIAAHYHRAYALAHETGRDARTVDRILALFGAPVSFPNADTVTPGDRYSAGYAERRDNEMDPQPGLYRRMQAKFIEARGASVAGNSAAMDAALADIFRNWERVCFATAVNYLGSSRAKFEMGGASNQVAGLHELSEATGFVLGWRMLPTGERVATDADVDALLGMLRTPPGMDADPYLFATDTTANLSRFQMALDRIQSVEGFSDAEMMAFQNVY